MAKKRRRAQQQHLGQETQRRRRYGSGTSGGEKYKPGFPMSLFMNSTAFYVVGAVVMIGGVALAFLLQSNNPSHSQDADPDDIVPTPTAVESPEASPTPDNRTFEQALVVTDSLRETYTATVTTAKGEFTIELFAEEAPNTVNSFVFLARNGFYNGLTFHRVVENFVAQAGDPNGTPGDGRDGPGYVTADEPNEIHNEPGTIAMAKIPGQTVFGSQFFINLKANPGLDFDSGAQDRFYPFGEVTEGFDVVLALEQGDIIESIEIHTETRPDAPPPDPAATPVPEDEDDAGAGEGDGEEATATATP